MSHIYPDPMPTSFTAVGHTGPYQPQLQRPMSNQINDGGPAFPAQDWKAKGNHHPGMTLRDYFAAAALHGLMASIQPNQIWSCDDVAVTCHRMADAMLKAREVKP